MKFKLIAKTLLLSLSFSTVVNAYDGVVSGKVYELYFKGNVSSQAVGIRLEGTPALCGSGTDSAAYVDKDNYSYQAFASMALAAKMAGTRVKLISNHDATSGKCRLQQMVAID